MIIKIPLFLTYVGHKKWGQEAAGSWPKKWGQEAAVPKINFKNIYRMNICSTILVRRTQSIEPLKFEGGLESDR